MAEREQVHKPGTSPSRSQSQPTTAKSERAEELKSELDDLLDEIDEVLETNAEEFVKGYIQKGGQ